MIWKRCSRCGKRLPTGVTCDCIKQRHKEYNQYSRDKTSADFYDSTDWKKMRKRVMQIYDGMDLYLYETTGEVVAAETVHHIEPLKDNWDKRLDVMNLIPVSASTHNQIHKLYETKQRETENKLRAIVTDALIEKKLLM